MQPGISPRMRQRMRREEREHIESKRASILMAMDPDTRAEHEDATLTDLILLKQTGRLNMLPGLDA